MAASEGGRRVWAMGEGGKDVVVVASRAELEGPPTMTLPPPEPAPGLVLPDGSINWGCPCLGGMAAGPCGAQFRDAFSCFHYSEAEPKGSDCYEKFSVMQECMSQYPELYAKDDEDDDELAAVMEASGGDGDTEAPGDRGAPGDKSAAGKEGSGDHNTRDAAEGK